MIAIAAAVVTAILLTADLEDASDLVSVLLVGVSLAVAAVPEGLPAVLSVVSEAGPVAGEQLPLVPAVTVARDLESEKTPAFARGARHRAGDDRNAARLGIRIGGRRYPQHCVGIEAEWQVRVGGAPLPSGNALLIGVS